jgi:hypothetical protein
VNFDGSIEIEMGEIACVGDPDFRRDDGRGRDSRESLIAALSF